MSSFNENEGIDRIAGLFTLFSGENNVEKYMPLISLSIHEVESGLKEDADTTDERLVFLCASIANFHYTQITAARDRTAFTQAGTAAKIHNGQQQYDFAYSLMRAYRASVKDLMRDEAFAFLNV